MNQWIDLTDSVDSGTPMRDTSFAHERSTVCGAPSGSFLWAVNTAVVNGRDDAIVARCPPGLSAVPSYTRRDGNETMLAWKAEKPLRGVHPLPSRQAET
jgi:hypothetical protein